MKVIYFSRVAIATIGLTCILASCGLTGSNAGDDEAAMSCMQDLESGNGTERIIAIGLIESETSDIPTNQELLADVRKRAILAAAATAKDAYWQPLADAWALNEALIQSVIGGGPSVDDAGNLVANSGSYESFLKDVNLQYAAVSKDTYCRIAFTKKDMPINYESDDK